MAIYRLGDREPRIDPTAWIAESAELIGLVELAAESEFDVTVTNDEVEETVAELARVMGLE